MVNKTCTFLGKLPVCAMLMIGLSGCMTESVNTAANNVKADGRMTSDIFLEKSKITSESAVESVDKYWLAGKPFTLSERESLPDFFNNPAAYSALDPVSFQEMISEVSIAVGRRIVLTPDALAVIEELESKSEKREGAGDNDSAASLRAIQGSGLKGSSLLFQIDHVGTIRSLLDIVTSKANLFWKWDQNVIKIFRNETRTFILDALAGTSSFQANVISTGESTSSEDGGTQSTTGLDTSMIYKPSDTYEDIKLAFEALMSEGGSYSISQQTGTITFTDTPVVLQKVEQYMEQLNSIINKRIGIRTEVYEVSLSDDTNVGIDWNVLYSGSNDFSISLLNSSNTTDSGDLPLIDFGVVKSGNDFNGSSAFINALRQMTNVSLVTTSSVFTTNGQPAPMQVLDTQAYLKSRTLQLSDEGDVEGVELEAGLATEGISMSLLPKVTANNDILLQVAMDLSIIKEIKEFGTAGNTIQLPSRAVKNFLQRVNVESGETVLISGFERVINTSENNSIFSPDLWFLGGKKGGGEKRIMTLILITPHIMQR